MSEFFKDLREAVQIFLYSEQREDGSIQFGLIDQFRDSLYGNVNTYTWRPGAQEGANERATPAN